MSQSTSPVCAMQKHDKKQRVKPSQEDSMRYEGGELSKQWVQQNREFGDTRGTRKKAMQIPPFVLSPGLWNGRTLDPTRETHATVLVLLRDQVNEIT